MKGILMRISNRNKTTVRTMLVSLFMIFCAVAAIIASGYVFTIVEENAFGNKAAAFKILNENEFVLFGNTVKLPIISGFIKVKEFITRYAPGVIKLLGFAINGAEELIENVSYKIVSSLK